MKKAIFAMLLALSAFALHAEEYPSVLFKTVDGKDMTIESKGLEISFDSGNLIAKSATSSLTLSVNDLKSMSFSDLTSSIIAVAATDATDNIQVTVFKIDGSLVGTFPSVSEVELSLSSDIYIAKKSNGEILKIAVK